MSKKVIDEKVVEMRFDNRDFETNIKTSMSTLERFKQSLYFKGATKGLDDVNKAAKNVDMTHLGKGLEMVQAKFSALEVMGVTALANLTNSAVNAGKRIVKALTIDPVTTGFNEYETKINAIQTIISNTASKGTTMEDVTRVINELNTYADKTIYNFAEMTKNIGTFTAAGVGLEESAAAIQGIANLAAASGSTSQQASTAMYQLSQALAAGTVKLMDWNSVVNAGMGGEKFQEALKATAREHGIAVDKIIKKNGSFRESLSDGWISAEILNTTLNKFTVDGAKNYADSMLKSGKYTKEQADALIAEAQAMEDAATKVKTFTQLWDTMKESVQSGWAQTWEIIIGNFDEAKEFLSNLSETFGKVIEKISNARNNLLKGGLNSKWDQLVEKIEAAGLSSEKFQEIVKETAKKSGIPIDKLIKKYGTLQKVINAGKIPANIFTTALKKLIGLEDETAKATDKVTGSVKDLEEIVKKVIRGDFGNGEARVKALTEAGYDYATVQNRVNEILGSSVRHTSKLTEEQLKNADQLVKLSDEQLKNKGYTEDQIEALRELQKAADGTGSSISDLINDIEKPSGRQLLLDSVHNVLKAISKILGAIAAAWRETFDPMTGNDVYGFVEGLNKLTEALIISDESAENFQRVMEGLFSLFKLATGVISRSLVTGVKLASAVLSLFGTNLLEVAAIGADYIVKFRKWVEEHTIFIGTIDKLAKIIKIFIEGIRKCVNAFLQLDVVKKSIERFKDLMTDLFGSLKDGFGGLNIDSFYKALEKAFDKLVNWIKGLNDSKNIGKDIIKGIVKGLQIGVKGLVDGVIKIAKTIIDTFKDILGIHSPSTVMIALGKFLIAGLILGIVGSTTGLFDKVKAMGSKLFTLVKENIGKLIDWVKGLDLPEIKMEHILGTGLVIGLVLTVKKLLDVVQMFGKGVEGFGEMCSGAGKLMSDFGDRINPKKNKFSEAGTAMLKMAGSIAILAASVYLLAQLDGKKLWSAVGAIAALTVLVGGLTIVAGKLNVKTADFGKITTLLMGLAGSLLVMSIALKQLDFLNSENIGPVLAGLAGIVAGMVVLLVAFGKLTKGTLAKNIDKAAIVISKISLTMLLLSFSIRSMSKLEPDALKQGMITLTLFGAFITALIFATKLAGPNINGLGATILKIAATMGLLVLTIKLINGLEPAEITKGVLCITLFGGLITGLIAATRLAGGKGKKLGSTIMGIAGAMTIMALTIKIISGLDASELTKGLICITIFGGIIVALIAAVSKVKGQVKGVAATILAISVAIGVLAGLAIVLGMISLEGLAKGVTAVSILAGMMAIIIHSLKGAEKAKGSLIVLTVALGILVAAVVGLSFLDPAALARSTAAISIVMGMFALLLASTKLTKNSKKVHTTMLMMIGVVAALGGIVVAMSALNPDAAIHSATALSILLTAFSASMIMLGNVGRVSQTAKATMPILLGIVTGLAVILGTMSALNVEASISSAVSLSILLNAMAAALLILDHVQTISGSAMGAMGILTAVVAGLATVLGTMSGLGVEASIPSAIALSVLLNAMAAALLMLDHVHSVSMSAIGAMAVLGLVVGELALILGLMNGLGVEASIPTAVALSTLLLAMSAALLILTPVGAAGPAAFVGIAALEVAIIAIAGLIVTLGALTAKFPIIEEFLDKGISLLEQLAKGIGSIIGSFIAGIAEGAMSFLPKLGTVLSEFMTNVTPFINGVKMVDGTVLKGTATLAGAIILLSAANLINGIASFSPFASSFADLGSQLSAFITNAMPFITGIKLMTPEVANGAKALAETVLILTAADVLNGLTSWFTGGSSFSDFGSQLGGLGTNLKQFSDNLGTFDDSKVTTVNCAAKAIKSLAQAASEIPNEGGWAAAICGDNSLASFGEAFPALGKQLASFITNLGTFDESKVTTVDCAGKALKALASAANEIPNEGGWAAAICGDNSLVSFGNALPTLGSQLNGFITNLGTFDESKVTTIDCAGKAIKALAQAAGDIPNEGGWAAAICGDNSLASFGDKLPGLGTNLKGFVNNLGEFSEAQVTTVGSATKAIKAMAQLGEAGVSGTFSGLSILGDQMVIFAGDIKNFVTKVTEAGDVSAPIDKVKKLISLAKTAATTNVASLKTFGTSLTNAAKEGVKGFVNAFKDSKPKTDVIDSVKAIIKGVIDEAENSENKVKKSFKSLATAASKALDDSTAKSDSKDAGKALIKKFIAGMEDKQTAAKDAAELIASDSVSAMQSETIYEDAKSAGSYVVSGFAAGITANTFKAKAKAEAMASAALSAAKAKLQEHSPSKAFYKIGAYGGEGFVNAFVDYESKSYKAGASIAEYATKGLSNAVSKMRNMIENGVDGQPTIRPVLDLSEVSAGVGAINGMFNAGPSLGVTARVSAIGAMMNSRQNGVGGGDVVSAIKDLGRKIGNIKGNTTIIDGVTYDDGSNINNAVEEIVRAARVERRT